MNKATGNVLHQVPLLSQKLIMEQCLPRFHETQINNNDNIIKMTMPALVVISKSKTVRTKNYINLNIYVSDNHMKTGLVSNLCLVKILFSHKI